MQLDEIITNATRRLGSLFPGYFTEHKHNHYFDFGWPVNITFEQLHSMYLRNGLAKAAVVKTSRKVWQDIPYLLESEDKHRETPIEIEIRRLFSSLRFWQRIAEADRRSMVGRYSGVILRLRDDKPFREPVDMVPGGFDGLAEIIPAWEGQLHVAEYDTDPNSETYGQPTMFQFNEAQVKEGNPNAAMRSFEIHPDRVVVWSQDGTVNCTSMLEAGYNDLLTLEKVSGAGGEGFWKNSKSAPVLEIDKEADLAKMARVMNVTNEDLVNTINDQVEAFQKGLDKTLLLQGIKATQLNATLPVPEHFRAGPLENFAASFEIPVKVLVGMQTGERASTEDASEWARTCMGRRSDYVVPNIMAVVNRLEAFGILPERDWFLDWADLTEASIDAKIERAKRMSEINRDNANQRELIFTPEEIRDVIDLEPLTDADKFVAEDEEPPLPRMAAE